VKSDKGNRGMPRNCSLYLNVLLLLPMVIACAAFAQNSPASELVCELREFGKVKADARAGLADAQFLLGTYYDTGRCVGKDALAAAKLYEAAEAAGSTPARHNLAVLYLNGTGVRRDSKKALALLDKNVTEQFPLSMNTRALTFISGDVSERDVKHGLRLLEAAANLGSGDASFNLGEIMQYGKEGLPIDHQVAFGWYLKAAGQGVVPAAQRVCEMYRRGWGVKKDFRQAQLWCERAAKQGDVMAQNIAGGLAYGGHPGAEVDQVAAVRWWSMAAAQGNADAEFFLGMAYESGRGVAKDPSVSRKWFEQAAAHGQPDAVRRLKQSRD
jgi:uncharacterized protein